MILDRKIIRERFAPSKRMGQNFLMDMGIIERMVSAINPAETDTIMEVGPGLGALTGQLLKHKATVHAIELDTKLHAYLTDYYRNNTLLHLVHSDILKYDPRPVAEAAGGSLRLVGNLPYSISHAIIEWIIHYSDIFADAFLTLQTEVARRLYASPCTKDYSPQTVVLGYFFKAERALTIPPHVFCPQPNVESTYVRLTANRTETAPTPEKYILLRQIVRAAFTHRRKMLKNNLNTLVGGNTSELAERSSIHLGRRAEELERHEYLALADAIQNMRAEEK